MNEKKLENLPPNSDEYWEGAETYRQEADNINICVKHFYLDNHDGTISCKFCPYGTRLSGYMKLYEGKIVDLRNFTGE